ncbi:MAG: amidase [Planctomycetota bacterium]
MSAPTGSLTALLGLLRSGGITPGEAAAACLARMAERDGEVRAFLEEPGREARVMAEAREVEKRWTDAGERPALFGVPVGVKDLFNVNGLPTRAGSALPPEEFAGSEAIVVMQLRHAGAVILGKTATDEFAYADPPETRNPRDLTRSPGGSSAGSAAAVAAGMCPLGIGTQTSRSIIAPAAYCGVAGFKPSHGRLPLHGVFPLAPSMDVVGFLADDAAGLAIAAAALVKDWREVAPRKLRLGVPEGRYLMDLPAEGWLEPFRAAVEDLRRQFEVVAFDSWWDSRLEKIYKDCMALLHGEFAQSHARLFDRHAPLYRRASRLGVETGRRIADTDVAIAREAGLVLRGEISEALRRAGIDVLLSPSQPGPAPLVGGRTGSGSTTAPWSFAGLPCVSVPWGTVGGLPVGLQLIGSFGDDEALLAAAVAIERAAPGPGR